MDPPSSDHNKSSSEKPHHHEVPSSTELLSNAKLVAEAAKSTLGRETDQIDKGRVAGAAANLLGAASNYGKFEEKSFGRYVEKAEDYLHQYHSSHSTTTTTTTTTTHISGSPTDGGDGTTQSQTSSHSVSGGPEGKSSGSGGGFGDYLKMAEGFLKKN